MLKSTVLYFQSDPNKSDNRIFILNVFFGSSRFSRIPGASSVFGAQNENKKWARKKIPAYV
jgi:hypothetical protein